MGGSEGAMIVAMAAPLVPETRGVVLLSGGGGLTFGEEVVQSASAQMLESGMPPEKVEQEADAMRQFMTTFAKDPTPYKEWGSDGRLARNTHLWWAHAVNLRLSTPLLQTPAPLLILHGRSDQGTPYRSAELLLQTLTFSHKTNLEFRPYSGGHSPPEEEVLKAVEWAVERF